MIWTMQLYRLSTALIIAKLTNDPLPGGASPVLLIDRKSTRSSDEISEIDSYHQTFRRSLNRVVQQTINCFSVLPHCQKARTARPHATAFSSRSELQSAPA